MIEELASYHQCVEHIRSNWPAFLERRKERLAQQERQGVAAEKVAENTCEAEGTVGGGGFAGGIMTCRRG
jgi:hypothetical protein